MKLIDTLKSKKIDVLNTFPYRSYFNRCECVFVHIPKSAGTSILKGLSNGDQIYRDHCNWFDFYRANKVKFSNYFKFTVVRDPFDRIVSTYEYLKKGGNQAEDLFFMDLFALNNLTFEEFVLEYLDEVKIHEHVLFKPQYLFIFDYKYDLKVDFIAKFENIDADYALICNKLGIKKSKLVKENSSPRQLDVNCYKRKNVANRVASLYRKDYELLDYDKSWK